MRVSVELPDPPRLEPLLESLSRQYQDVLDQLMSLQREDRVTPILHAVQSQTDGLVQAFQHMLGMMQQGKQQEHQAMQDMMRQEVAAPQQEANDALLSAIRGLKRSVSGLPDNLGTVMNKHMKSRQHELMKMPPAPSKPVPNTSRDIVQKLDEMERALVYATRRSRSRTFGSNY